MAERDASRENLEKESPPVVDGATVDREISVQNWLPKGPPPDRKQLSGDEITQKGLEEVRYHRMSSGA